MNGKSGSLVDLLPARDAVSGALIDSLRGFNRFYTRHIGALDQHLLDTGFSLTQARILWELAQQPGMTASQLVASLALDSGYLSRCLKHLRTHGLVEQKANPVDRRNHLLKLSLQGRKTYTLLDKRAIAQARAWLARLDKEQQESLGHALNQVSRLLANPSPDNYSLRDFRAGDLGWIVERHGAVYFTEYGWDQRFEAMVARIAADFLEQLDRDREQAWIAEIDAQRAGSVVLVKARDKHTGKVIPGVAQLRLLLVEKWARGRGIGKALTAQCESFARTKGYKEIRLWTNKNLLAARGIYQASGYQLVSSETHRSFGHRLTGEYWRLPLV